MKDYSSKDGVNHHFATILEEELQGIMAGKVGYVTRMPLDSEVKTGDVVFLSTYFVPAMVRCAIEVLEVIEMRPVEAWGRFKAALDTSFNDEWSFVKMVNLIRIGDVRVLETPMVVYDMGIMTAGIQRARVRLAEIPKLIECKNNRFFVIGR